MLLTRVARDRSHWHAISVRDVHGADSERREASGAINHRRRERLGMVADFVLLQNATSRCLNQPSRLPQP